MLYQTVLLHMQNALAHDRSISGAYYVLTGKQSIQTIQDAKLFRLEPYYGTYRSLKKQTFMKQVKKLEDTGLLQAKTTDNHFELTEEGREFLHDHGRLLQNYFFQGTHYHTFDRIFYKRLSLLVQVWTNAQQNNPTYIPVVDDPSITNWVKQKYRQLKQPASAYLSKLYEEFSFVFESLQVNEAIHIWVRQLTGYKRIGWTEQQLAVEYKKSAADIHLLTTSINHMLLNQIDADTNKLPLLSLIAAQEGTASRLTKSAQKTAQLLPSHSLEEIAQERCLKLNTIYDHIVEISLNEAQFPLERFVSPPVQIQIEEAMKQAGSWKLKDIKALLPEQIRYFDIRLVLTHVQSHIDKGVTQSG